MGYEVEAKFRVADFRAVREALRAAGAVFLGAAMETDRFFDTPDGRLHRAGRVVRLRNVRLLRATRGGRKGGWLLTAKGPEKACSRAKVRPEAQTPVADGKAMAAVLKAVGLVPVISYRKRRSSYRLGRCAVELDQVALLGRFVEIEAPRPGQVWAAARKLGLAGQPLAPPYVQMLLERKGKRTSR